MNITGAKEAEIRAAIKAALELLAVHPTQPADVGHVFERPRLITDRNDFVAKLSRLVADKKEIRYVELSFARFQDDDTEGCDDEPVVGMSFTLHLFQEFVDNRSDDTNSTATFTNTILAIRNYFLWNRNLAPGMKARPVVQNELARFGQDTLTDCTGHFADLVLTVDYYGD